MLYSCQFIWTDMRDILTFHCSSFVSNTMNSLLFFYCLHGFKMRDCPAECGTVGNFCDTRTTMKQRELQACQFPTSSLEMIASFHCRSFFKVWTKSHRLNTIRRRVFNDNVYFSVVLVQFRSNEIKCVLLL